MFNFYLDFNWESEFTFTVILNVVKNLFGQPHKIFCYICGVN